MEIKINFVGKGYSIFDPDCPLKILTEILEKEKMIMFLIMPLLIPIVLQKLRLIGCIE